MSERNNREDARESIAETDANASAGRSCPECDGPLVADDPHGETVCGDCGLVVATDAIDRGPEWQAHSTDEKTRKSRVGAPVTPLRHDRGLHTDIDWRDADAKGRQLNARQRRKVQRLRLWNRRSKLNDARARNLRQALSEIDRMASALGLPEEVREMAAVIYRRALDAELLPGRSIEAMATAALYAAARQADVPRTLDELAAVSRIDKPEFTRAYRYLVRELQLAVSVTTPTQYVRRFASELDASARTERTARELLEIAREAGITSGKSPVTLAAAALYAAGRITDDGITQDRVAETADVSDVTIRTRYRELLSTAAEARSDLADAAAAALDEFRRS